MISLSERTSVIIIRLWRVPDDDGLRVRITIVRDLDADEADTVVTAEPHEVVRIVDRFLQDFAEN